MTDPASGRRPRRTEPAPRVRMLHLGLGNFFRAHQAWYTHRANTMGAGQAASGADGEPWGIAAFTGRRPNMAEVMAAQDGVYTLDVRGPDGDDLELVESVVASHAASDHEAWLGYWADPEVRVVTSTVTEAGYRAAPGGGPDLTAEDVLADLAALEADQAAPVTSVPGRLLSGLLARRRADAGPIAVVPCDNLPDNAAVVRAVVLGIADRVDPGLREWADAHVRWVTTMVDRITPATTEADVELVRELAGHHDRTPVVTEPFSEWVLSGDLSAGAPDWGTAGATLTDDVAPFEERKLWLLNGAHTLLAYAGPLRGHETIADAVADDVARGWVEELWDEASGHLTLPADDVAAYRRALVERFENPRIRHLLAQIAADGSQKIPVRVLPTLRRERAAGRMPDGATRAVAAWLAHLAGHGTPIKDPRGDELSSLVRSAAAGAAAGAAAAGGAVGAAAGSGTAEGGWAAAARGVLFALEAQDLADDDAVVARIADHAEQLTADAR